MAVITINVSDEDAGRVAVACAALHPIPMIPDPTWEKPEDDPKAIAPLVPKYSLQDWPAAYYKGVVAKDVVRFEKMQQQAGLTEPTIEIS